MATTEDTVALQKGAIAPAQKEQTGSQKAVSLIDSLITKPSLPTGTTISPQLQNVASQELLATPGVSGTLGFTAPTTTAAPTIAARTKATEALKSLDINSAPINFVFP